jgi:hypothetical protein
VRGLRGVTDGRPSRLEGMTRARRVIDALEVWRASKEALDAATPRTAEWLRLRMIEQDNRLAYEQLIDLEASHVYTVSASDDGRYWAVEVRDSPGLVTKASRLDYALQAIRELIAAEGHLDPRSIELNVVILGSGREAGTPRQPG